MGPETLEVTTFRGGDDKTTDHEGLSAARIIFSHILPNAVSPILVVTSLTVATAILLESALSFLGLGDPNLMSWGFMIGAERTRLENWLATATDDVPAENFKASRLDTNAQGMPTACSTIPPSRAWERRPTTSWTPPRR